MDRKQMCVANVQYKKPSADGSKQSKNLLRYLTYRESRDEAARHVAGRERWVDHGMGGSVAEIAQHRIKAVCTIEVIRIAAGFFGIVTDISVQPHGFGLIATGKFAQNFVTHSIAAVAVDVGRINVNADSRS